MQRGADDHSAEEEADDTIYAMWPGEEETETATWESTCVSDEGRAECEAGDETRDSHRPH